MYFLFLFSAGVLFTCNSFWLKKGIFYTLGCHQIHSCWMTNYWPRQRFCFSSSTCSFSQIPIAIILKVKFQVVLAIWSARDWLPEGFTSWDLQSVPRNSEFWSEWFLWALSSGYMGQDSCCWMSVTESWMFSPIQSLDSEHKLSVRKKAPHLPQ